MSYIAFENSGNGLFPVSIGVDERRHTGLITDISVPVPDAVFFYLLRNDTAGTGYGTSSDGGERLPSSGACP